MEGEAGSYEEIKPNVVVKQSNGDIVGDNDVGNLGSGETPDFLSKKISQTAGKVREIMLIAATAAAGVANSADMKNVATDCATTSPVLTRSPSLQSTATATALTSPKPQVYPINRPAFCKLQELPIARRHSLQRFFEKRRDRLVNRNPYPNPSTPKSFDDTKANPSATASPESGCFGKSPLPREEFQPKAPAHAA